MTDAVSQTLKAKADHHKRENCDVILSRPAPHDCAQTRCDREPSTKRYPPPVVSSYVRRVETRRDSGREESQRSVECGHLFVQRSAGQEIPICLQEISFIVPTR